jgi:hypothetical protein
VPAFHWHMIKRAGNINLMEKPMVIIVIKTGMDIIPAGTKRNANHIAIKTDNTTITNDTIIIKIGVGIIQNGRNGITSHVIAVTSINGITPDAWKNGNFMTETATGSF